MIEKITIYNNQQQYSSPSKNNKKERFVKKYNQIKCYRNHSNSEPDKHTKMGSALGSTIGVLAPLAGLMAIQKQKNPLNIKYGLGEMVALSLGGIIGGITGGSLKSTKQERTKKSQEGVFQFLNMAMPAGCVAGAIKICEKVERLNNIPAKIAGTLIGLATGISSGVKLSNKIVDPKDKEPDRKLTIKDSVANLDDAVGILVLADVKAAKKIKIERALPLIYTYCGYRAGNCN